MKSDFNLHRFFFLFYSVLFRGCMCVRVTIWFWPFFCKQNLKKVADRVSHEMVTTNGHKKNVLRQHSRMKHVYLVKQCTSLMRFIAAVLFSKLQQTMQHFRGFFLKKYTRSREREKRSERERGDRNAIKCISIYY